MGTLILNKHKGERLNIDVDVSDRSGQNLHKLGLEMCNLNSFMSIHLNAAKGRA